jgi:hypothetical protein
MAGVGFLLVSQELVTVFRVPLWAKYETFLAVVYDGVL